MIKYILKHSIFILPLLGLNFLIFQEYQAIAILSGFILSSIFVLSSAWVIEEFWGVDSIVFTKIYFFSMAIRMLLIIVVMGILLGLTKIDEIFFTVSLIISYLYQSVKEMIFINKILLKKKQ